MDQTQRAQIEKKLSRLQERLNYKKNWFTQKIHSYQERMKLYSENKAKQIEGCRQSMNRTALPKSKVS